MKKKMLVVAVAAMLALSIGLLAACGPTTSHRGRLVDGSFTVFETEFNYITAGEFTTLRNAWFPENVTGDALETHRDNANFIMGLSGGFFGSALWDQRPTYRRQMLPLDMWGDTDWITPRGVEREVGQGFFDSQSVTVFVDENIGATMNAMIEHLGLGMDTIHTNFNFRMQQRWNAEGDFMPGGSSYGDAAHLARQRTNRESMRAAITTHVLPQRYRDLGYHFVGDSVEGIPGALPLFSFPEVNNVRRVRVGSIAMTRFIRQTITRIENYYAEANVRGAHRIDFIMPESFSADGSHITTSTITILQGEEDHRLRPILMNRSVRTLYDRGTQADHWMTTVYFGNQVHMMIVPNITLEFILDRPAGH